MDAELTVSARGVVEVTPDEFGTVRVEWPDGTITEIRRGPDDPDLVRSRIYSHEHDIARLLIQENYGRPNRQGKLITGLQIERTEQAVLTRAAGWDSAVRRLIAERFGSLEACANHYGIDTTHISPDITGRRRAMKIWSRIVAHWGDTYTVADEVLGMQPVVLREEQE